MAEEKKDQTKETPKTETPKEHAPKAETPKAETPAKEAPKAEAPKEETIKAESAVEKKVEETKEEKKKEKPSNCAACNKSIKKKRYYYRDGKHYCTKRCWKTTIKKEEKVPEVQNPSDAKDQPPAK